MNELEKRFNKDMRIIYDRAHKELGYKFPKFLKLLAEKGGVEAAKSLVSKPEGTEGFTVLWEYKRLDLSVEALIIRHESQPLFPEDIIELCKSRLKEYGYETEE